MADLEPLLRFWRALDGLFDRVAPTWWGAVVSDRRFPAVQEANYARVESTRPVDLTVIEAELFPALADAGCARAHGVVFAPEEQTDLIAQASTRGEQIIWDLVMVHEGPSRSNAPELASLDRVEEVHAFDDAFWTARRASDRLFGAVEEGLLDQLSAMEERVLVPAGRRWFVVRGAMGTPIAFAALMVLEGIGFIDHVITVPEERRRGHATALTHRVLAEARATGVERAYLLAEPEGPPAAMYARLGFEPAGHLASWFSPIV